MSSRSEVKFLPLLQYKFVTTGIVFFYVLLTVHLSTILVINQLNAQILVL